MIGESCRHNLGNLFRFSGRDRRALFWPYAIMTGLVSAGLTSVAILPPIFASMQRIRAFADANPEQVRLVTGAGGTSITIDGRHPELMPDMGSIATGVGIAAMITILLMAASVVRRLHDSGRSGLWGMVPLALLATGLVGMRQMFAGYAPNGGLFVLLLLNNFLYLASLLLLLVFLLLPGTTGSNRFGPQATP